MISYYFKHIYIKTTLIITLTISYQFQTLIERIDTDFYCGSRAVLNNFDRTYVLQESRFQNINIFKSYTSYTRIIGCGRGHIIWYHDLISWYDIMKLYHGIISWYHYIMISYHNAIAWYHITISYHEIRSWYNIMIS